MSKIEMEWRMVKRDEGQGKRIYYTYVSKLVGRLANTIISNNQVIIRAAVLLQSLGLSTGHILVSLSHP